MTFRLWRCFDLSDLYIFGRSPKEDREIPGPDHRDPGKRLQVLQHPVGDWNQGSGELEEQGRPHPALPWNEGEQGEQRHKELQQAGSPWLLLLMECQILPRLEWWRLSEAMIEEQVISSHSDTLISIFTICFDLYLFTVVTDALPLLWENYLWV